MLPHTQFILKLLLAGMELSSEAASRLDFAEKGPKMRPPAAQKCHLDVKIVKNQAAYGVKLPVGRYRTVYAAS